MCLRWKSGGSFKHQAPDIKFDRSLSQTLLRGGRKASSIPSRPLTRRGTHWPHRLQLAPELPVLSPHVGRGSSFKSPGLKEGSSLAGIEGEARVTHDLGGRPSGPSQETDLLTPCPALPPPHHLLLAQGQSHSTPAPRPRRTCTGAVARARVQGLVSFP